MGEPIERFTPKGKPISLEELESIGTILRRDIPLIGRNASPQLKRFLNADGRSTNQPN